MNKRVSFKQIRLVVITVILIMIGGLAYVLINDKLNETIYFVNFDSNGGTRVHGQSVKINERVEKPSNPVRTGYEFNYWMLNNEEYDFNKPVKKHLTLVASWNKNEE